MSVAFVLFTFYEKQESHFEYTFLLNNLIVNILVKFFPVSTPMLSCEHTRRARHSGGRVGGAHGWLSDW